MRKHVLIHLKCMPKITDDLRKNFFDAELSYEVHKTNSWLKNHCFYCFKKLDKDSLSTKKVNLKDLKGFEND